jgi:TolB protein
MRAFRTTLEVITVTLLACLWMSCNKSNPVKPVCPSLRIVALSPYGSPVWHPSGQFIGFNHRPLKQILLSYDDRGCLTDVRYEWELDSSGFWLINVDGTEMRRILSNGLGEPDWSPDGEWVAFEAGAQIYKIHFTGTMFDPTTLTQLTFEGRNFYPSWSPDGEWIAFDSDAESPNGMNFIWKMKTDGSQKRRIAYEPAMGEIRTPCWSPDGKKIVHIRYIGISSPEIFVMDTNGTNSIRLTFNNSDDRNPKYSPDGTKIAFLSQRRAGEDLVHLWVMNADGSGLRQLTNEGVGEAFSWSPDSKEIVYLSYRFTDFSYKNGTLWIINIETGAKRQLTFNYPP